MTNIKNKQLLDWLISRSDTTLEINDKRYNKYDIRYIFFRWKIQESLDIIYVKEIWGDPIILDRSQKPEYVGIFSHIDQTMYDVHWTVHPDRLIDPLSYTGDGMLNAVKEKAKEKIWDMLIDPSSDFPVKTLADVTDPAVIANYENFLEKWLEKEAIQSFVDVVDHEFYFYPILYWEDSTICRYILAPDQFISETVEELISKNAENYYLQYLKITAIKRRSEEIQKDPTHPAQAAKKIKEAIEEYRSKKEIKTVTIVLLDKDEEEVAFKIRADSLIRDLITGFDDWSLADVKSRKLFIDRMADPNGYHYAKDIIRITYGKNVLYDKAEFENSILDKFIKDAKEQLEEQKCCSELGEPQAWIYLPNGRSLEITHEENGLQQEDQFYSWRVHCSDKEYEKEKFCKTNGVIDYIVSDDINDTTLRENISWAYALSKKVDF